MLAQRGYDGEIADLDAAARLRREREAYIASETDPLVKIGLLLDDEETKA
jgi:hypothetical protein